MLQPDIFFAYGLSSGLAVVARKKLAEEKSPFLNKYFLGVAVWLAVFYVPQVIYLLFSFPAWESMHVFRSLQDIPPWFAGLYFAAVMLMGFLGWYVTYYFLVRGRIAAAMAQAGWSLAAATLMVFVGWDGTGLSRLLYTGNEWTSSLPLDIAGFFKSPVFFTLLWLEALVLIPYNAMLIRWFRQSFAAK